MQQEGDGGKKIQDLQVGKLPQKLIERGTALIERALIQRALIQRALIQRSGRWTANSVSVTALNRAKHLRAKEYFNPSTLRFSP